MPNQPVQLYQGDVAFKQKEIIIIMYIYHALINTLSTHMTHVNLNTTFYTHMEHSSTKTIYIR